MAHEEPGNAEGFARLDGIHILIVDDDEDARTICDAMLRYAGATARVVGSALAAARTLRGTFGRTSCSPICRCRGTTVCG
jgi:hypothetical protein